MYTLYACIYICIFVYFNSEPSMPTNLFHGKQLLLDETEILILSLADIWDNPLLVHSLPFIQLADAKDVMKAVCDVEDTKLPVLTPNLKVGNFLLKKWGINPEWWCHRNFLICCIKFFLGLWSSCCSRCKRSSSLCICFRVLFKVKH